MHGCSSGGTSCSYSSSNCGVSASSGSTPGISVSTPFISKNAAKQSSSSFRNYLLWFLFSFICCVIVGSWGFLLWIAITGLIILSQKRVKKQDEIIVDVAPFRQLKPEHHSSTEIYRLRRMI